MTTNAGQSLIPHPWRERKKFNDSRRLIAPIVKLTRTLAYLAAIACPPSFVLWMWAKFAFRRYNDAWHKRGFLLLLIGAVLALIFVPDPMVLVTTWYEIMRSFGASSRFDTLDSILRAVLLAGPYAVAAQGLHAMARTYQVEKTTNAFLKPQRPTLMMRLRKRRNINKLRHGKSKAREGKGYVRFGVIEDDRIPWRQSRHGMIVERKIAKMGHGVMIGANGMGKTKAAETFTYYVLKNNSAMIYIDFKASLGTMNGLAAVARDTGRPCHVLDIGFGTDDTSWYDLFAWPGSPADKASVLIECLQFAEGNDGAAYYRGIAEAWLPMQIEAAELLGLRENEGMFDFLSDTAVPSRFQERITPLRESEDPETREKFKRWIEEAKHVKTTDLQGLRNELTKIINAAGHRLKPNAENPEPVSMKEVMDNGGMVYIGIASGINDVVVKVLGSFLFKELSILVSARSRVPDTNKLRDVFVIPDEASEMEERSVVMNPIYTMAREARVFIWPSFQSFAVWDESTQEEIRSNARNFVAFSIPSRETAEQISSTLPDIFALQQMSQEETRQQAFQNQTVGISGDTRLSVATDAFLRPNIELSDVPAYHAYIWFKDAPRITRGRWRGRRRVRKDENRGDAPLVKLVPYDLVMEEADIPTLVNPEHSSGPEPMRLANPAEQRPALDATQARHDGTATTRADETKGSSADSDDDFLVTVDSAASAPSAHSAADSSPATQPPRRTEPQESAGQQSAEAQPPALPSFAARGATPSPRKTDASTTDDDAAPLHAAGDASTAEVPSSHTPQADDFGADPTSDWAVDALNSGAATGRIPDPQEDDEFSDDGAPTHPDSEDGSHSAADPTTDAIPHPNEDLSDNWTADGIGTDPESPHGEVGSDSSAVSDEAPSKADTPSNESATGTHERRKQSNITRGTASNKTTVASDEDDEWFV